MRKVKKILIPLLILGLLTGCGKSPEKEEAKEEKKSTAELTQIEYIPELSFPVYTADYESEYLFDKPIMNDSGDPVYFGIVREEGEGVESNYDYNKKGYQTPYLFGAAEDSSAPYFYPTYSDMNYESGSLSFTEKQFELYNKDHFVYEVGIPTSRNDNIYYGEEYANTPTSIIKLNNVNDFATVLDSVSYIHIRDISVTGDVVDMSEDEIVRKYVPAKFTTLDTTTLYGIAVAVEFDDQQYFYLMGTEKGPDKEEIEDIVSKIVPNNADAYGLFKETASRTETKSVSFDVNGIAGSIDIPGYFRTSEINNNIYSNALIYVPESNRNKDYPISQIPNNYGSSELLIKNEYLNAALTFNNFRKNEYMTSDKDFILYYYYMLYFGMIDDVRSALDNYDMEESDRVIVRDPVTDTNGNTWNSYIVYNPYIYEEENYPEVIPYGNYALIYTFENGDYVEMFSFSSLVKDWYLSEDLLNEIDKIPSSFSKADSNTEFPNNPLTFYVLPSEETATETDAEEVVEEESEEEATEEPATEAQVTDEDILDELGITQEDIDNADMIPEDE